MRAVDFLFMEERDRVRWLHGCQFCFAATQHAFSTRFDGARRQASGHQRFALQVWPRAHALQKQFGVEIDTIELVIVQFGFFIALIGRTHAAVSAQGALEAIHDEQNLLSLQGFEQFIHLLAFALRHGVVEIFECLFGEVLETRVAFVKRPENQLCPFSGVDVRVNPLPGESAFAESA